MRARACSLGWLALAGCTAGSGDLGPGEMTPVPPPPSGRPIDLSQFPESRILVTRAFIDCAGGDVCRSQIGVENWCGGPAKVSIEPPMRLPDCAERDYDGLCVGWSGLAGDDGVLELAPGARAEIPVEYRPGLIAPGDDGRMRRELVRLRTCPEEQCLATAEIVTRSHQPLTCTDVTFGGVCMGTCAVESVNCENAGGRPLTIGSVLITNSEFVPRGSFPQTIPPRGRVSFEIEYCPTGQVMPGPRISFEVQAAEGVSWVASPVNIDAHAVENGFRLKYPQINFGLVLLGMTEWRSNEIATCGSELASASIGVGAPFRVMGVASSLTVSPGETRRFDIAFAPGNAGPVSEELMITPFETGAAPIRVPLFGEGVNAPLPRCSVSVKPVGFGGVAIGGSVLREVSIANDGDGRCVFEPPAIEGDPFGVAPIDSLDPGESASLSVELRGDTEGLHEGTLVLRAEGSPPQTGILEVARVPLCGAVVDPSK